MTRRHLVFVLAAAVVAVVAGAVALVSFALGTSEGRPAEPAAAVAGEGVPADPVAWITARDLRPALPAGTDLYERVATVRHSGRMPGRTGNRHTAEVRVTIAGPGGPRPGPPGLNVGVTLTDEDCPPGGGGCRVRWAGSAGLPPEGAPWPAVAADGTVRVRATIPPAAWTGNGLPGPPTGDTALDVRITPTAWRDPRNPDPATADVVSRHADAAQDSLTAAVTTSGTAVTARGVVADVPADRVVSGTWRDAVSSSARIGPATAPVATPAQAAPYLPRVRDGRLVDGGTVAAEANGTLQGAGPLITGNGAKLPGNRYRVVLRADVPLAAGSGLTGDGGQLQLGIEARDCTGQQLWEACSPVELPQIVPGPARYQVQLGGRLRLQARAQVSGTGPDGSPRELGTLDVAMDVTPAGPGRGTRDAVLERRPGGPWEYRADVSSPATPRTTVGGRTLAGSTATLQFGVDGSGFGQA